MSATPGTYNATAIGSEAELGQSSKKGTPQITVPCHLDSGDTVTWVGFATPAAMPFTVKALRAMGWQGDDLSDLSTVGSKPFEVVLIEEVYGETAYIKVQFVNEIGGGPKIGKPMGDAEKKAFAARMRGAVRAAGAVPVASKEKPQAGPSIAPPVDDTDVPF